MHKYQPRVHVIRKECGEELSPVKAVPTGDGVKSFSFPETVFTTVTAYQNQQVTFNATYSLTAVQCMVWQIIISATEGRIGSKLNEEKIVGLGAFSLYWIVLL